MSEIKSWNDFLKPMEHELKDCRIDLGVEACRVDDDTRKNEKGIRSHCQIINPFDNQMIKSCDYFHVILEKSVFLCVEFSDLLAQQKQLDESAKELKQNKSVKSKERKTFEKYANSTLVIANELEQKFCATDFILRELYSEKSKQYVQDLPDVEYVKHFMIVYHNSNDVMDKIGSESIDKARLLDTENDDLKNSLLTKLKKSLAIKQFTHLNISRIHWVEIRDFKNRYC